jgi:2-keto-4-pentenoate hydratase/2-oxohepta-3-ene-1,7-dioic acid hydratase in catechol pathway
MRYCLFQSNSEAHYGLVESVAGHDHITRQILTPPEQTGDLDDLHTRRMDAIPFAEATLLAPVRPSKIVCVGRNYREHIAELGHEVPKEPLLFFKPPSSLNHPGGTIRRPRVSQRTDYEGELGIVIGRRCSKLAETEDVRSYILGYTAIDDFTARDLQKIDNQWVRAKGFDTFCPVGPLVTNEIDPWAGISVQTRVNGELKQNGNTRDLIFPLDVVLRYISNIMTLEPGDLIATGTPEGVAPVVAGDVVEVTVEGVGTLRNPIADE